MADFELKFNKYLTLEFFHCSEIDSFFSTLKNTLSTGSRIIELRSNDYTCHGQCFETRCLLLLSCNAEKVVISNIDCVVKCLKVHLLCVCNHFNSFDETLSLSRLHVQRFLLAIVLQRLHLLHQNSILKLVFIIPSGRDSIFHHYIDFYLVREFATSLSLFFRK